MARFHFDREFVLLLDDHSRIRFMPGEQHVDDEVADHPYLLDHGRRIADLPAESTTIPEQNDTDDRPLLLEKAAALGIAVDGRWGIARIRAAIVQAEGSRS